ncbi:hypothetical protein L581_1713 [Serratia fonticola AU-AP2C]|nr:hypothetical protein L581_1713 [Serratia fonticola AU-AP2C]
MDAAFQGHCGFLQNRLSNAVYNRLVTARQGSTMWRKKAPGKTIPVGRLRTGSLFCQISMQYIPITG